MPNAIYMREGTTKVFASSGGDATFTPTSLANGAGRVSAQVDLGAAPRAQWYRYTMKAKCATTPVVGNSIRAYLFDGDNASTTRQAGTVGTADAAVAAEALFLNASQQVTPLMVDAASTAKSFQAAGLVRITGRYVSVGWWNATGQALSATAGDMEFTLTPVYDEVQ